MSRIDTIDLLKYLPRYLRNKITFIEGFYISHSNEDEQFITFSEKKIDFNSTFKIVSSGIPLLKIIKNKIQILPGILDVVSVNKSLILEKSEAIEITKGRKIKSNNKDGIYLVFDKFNRRVALGLIENKLIIPIIDRGQYLRNE